MKEEYDLEKAVMAAPLPGDGLPIHTRFEKKEYGEDGYWDGYQLAGESLAHCFVVLLRQYPALRELPEDRTDAAYHEPLWDAFKERWSEGDEWIGGTTGFQFGWAHNAARHIVGEQKTAPNPALWQLKANG